MSGAGVILGHREIARYMEGKDVPRTNLLELTPDNVVTTQFKQLDGPFDYIDVNVFDINEPIDKKYDGAYQNKDVNIFTNLDDINIKELITLYNSLDDNLVTKFYGMAKFKISDVENIGFVFEKFGVTYKELGEDLKTKISYNMCIYWIYQILQSVYHLHKKNIYLPNINEDNIVISNNKVKLSNLVPVTKNDGNTLNYEKKQIYNIGKFAKQILKDKDENANIAKMLDFCCNSDESKRPCILYTLSYLYRYLISQSDETINNLLKSSHNEEITPPIYIKNLPNCDYSTHVGGNRNYNKYLKYKQKYLSLKNK
jgi:serine/threonine protein kinase